ncbi:TetR family transcriptional regulator C-terminal domain-containing protein [Kribbella sp. NPDC056861]|uniref:TetR/AcrR family transcriptional regulator n=1 Tax=Kribbella sp. NPDC056861 TaxID=3154857 RepID=UPI00344A94FE
MAERDGQERSQFSQYSHMVIFTIWLYDLRVPKIVDHQERRQLIAVAFQEQVAELGFSATTYARVAAGAGISVGLIQHYFADRHELLEYAYDDLIRRRDGRIDAAVAAGEKKRWSIRQILDRAMRELLPLDEQRRREHRIARQLQLTGSQDQALAALAMGAHEALCLRVRTAVSNGRECGEVEPDVDADVAALRIVSAIYGLADVLALQADATDNRTYSEVLDPVVATVFTGECRRA